MFKIFICILCFWAGTSFGEEKAVASCESALRTSMWDASMSQVQFDDVEQVLLSHLKQEMSYPWTKIASQDDKLRNLGFELIHQEFHFVRTLKGFSNSIDFIILKRFYLNRASGKATSLTADIRVSYRGRRASRPNIVNVDAGAVELVHPLNIIFDESMQRAYGIDIQNLVTKLIEDELNAPDSSLANWDQIYRQAGFRLDQQRIIHRVTLNGLIGPIDHLILTRTYRNRNASETKDLEVRMMVRTERQATASTVSIDLISADPEFWDEL